MRKVEDKIKKISKDNGIILVPVVTYSIFLAISILIWFRKYRTFNKLEDLLINIISGFFCSLLTVIFVNRSINRIKKNEEEPYYLMRYREIQLIMTNLIGLWANIYKSLNSKITFTTEELFTSKEFKYINDNFNILGKCTLDKSITWQEYISYINTKLRNQINAAIDKYGHNMGPVLFYDLNYLLEEAHILSISNNPITIHKKKYLIKHYIFLDDQESKVIKDLIEWCDEEYARLKNSKLMKTYQIKKSF